MLPAVGPRTYYCGNLVAGVDVPKLEASLQGHRSLPDKLAICRRSLMFQIHTSASWFRKSAPLRPESEPKEWAQLSR